MRAIVLCRSPMRMELLIDRIGAMGRPRPGRLGQISRRYSHHREQHSIWSEWKHRGRSHVSSDAYPNLDLCPSGTIDSPNLMPTSPSEHHMRTHNHMHSATLLVLLTHSPASLLSTVLQYARVTLADGENPKRDHADSVFLIESRT